MNELERELVERRMQEGLRQEKKRRKRRRWLNVLLAWLLAMVILAAVVVIVVIAMMNAGEKSLRKEVEGIRPNLNLEEEEQSEGVLQPEEDEKAEVEQEAEPETEDAEQTEEEENAQSNEVVWQDGWVRYNGGIYQYNEDIMNFLVLGIDKKGEMMPSSSLTGGGQSDGIFVVVVNPDEKDIKVLAINRDTMTKIKMYGIGENGSTLETVAQIAVQYGFGNGREESSIRTKETVSELLYGLPIHGYVSISVQAIPKLNDAVGGVEVTVLEDMTKVKKAWTQGATVTLKGDDARKYTQYRDQYVFESARGRLARQKQYLQAFINKAIASVKRDITVPVTLYQELSKHMVTDVSVDEVAYLAGELMDYHFDSSDVYTLEGNTVRGEQFEEFYPDKAALKNLMIELFYEEVILEDD